MFINYAHRGSSAYAPENTFMSFYLGVIQGADGIETDVQRTKDGILVLFHDMSLERCFGIDGAIADYTYDELKRLSVENNGLFDKIPKFTDFLEHFGWMDLTFAIEIKVPGSTEQEIVELIQKYNMSEKTYVTSESFEAIKRVKELDPNMRVGLLVWNVDVDPLPKLQEIGAEQLCPFIDAITPELVERVHSLNMEIRGWGIKDGERMRKVYDLKTDGTTVNFPDKLEEYRRQCGEKR